MFSGVGLPDVVECDSARPSTHESAFTNGELHLNCSSHI